MKIAVISSSPIISKSGSHYAYSPYVKELEIWAACADEVAFMCPVWKVDKGLLISEIHFPITHIFEAKEFHIKSLVNFLKAAIKSFTNFHQIYKAMQWADHIHLRCPGNIGLMGCIMQIFFPTKSKTAKYAGNWDPKAKQPVSYKIQKWILSNTFLTRNMKVLVYGEWPGTTKNILPFFTASYQEIDKLPVDEKQFNNGISFIFVGTFVSGKCPLYAVKLVEKMQCMGFAVQLKMYGNGPELNTISQYLSDKKLHDYINIAGNKPQDLIKSAYRESHFVILPSKSEGWPKVVAEGMFWGCLPIATRVSCVPFMLDQGNRGILLDMDLISDSQKIINLIQNPASYRKQVNASVEWSRQYTLDLFKNKIQALLKR